MTEERAFLAAILEKPDDDTLKLLYADWLEEQGDPRAEYLRLMMSVRRERVVSPEQRRQQVPARLQELAATLDPNWLAVVSDPEVERCGRNTGRAWRPRFDFVSDKTWADMRPTTDNSVRHCEACRKNVYFCETIADAREHSLEGHCIAVDLGIVRRDDDLYPRMMVAGQPSRESLRAVYEEDLDPVSQARLKTSRKRARKMRGRGQ
jgi:uncharacterized protein (TIGR02996 family)